MNAIEIRTGSDSDIPKIQSCYQVLSALNIDFSPRILSAHRTPDRMVVQAKKLQSEGFVASIAAAGGSAHLPGMTAAETSRPVIGIPVRSSIFGGIDSLLSIIQMPEGVPTGCVGIGDADAAGLFAAKLVALVDRDLVPRLRSAMHLDQWDDTRSGVTPQLGLINTIEGKENSVSEQFTHFMDTFGIRTITHHLYNDQVDEMADVVDSMEREGAAALVVTCDLMEAASRRIPGSIGASTHLPVIGLPFVEDPADRNAQQVLKNLVDYLEFLPASKNTRGMVSMGINRLKNTGLYATQILALVDSKIEQPLKDYRHRQYEEVVRKDEHLVDKGLDQVGNGKISL